MNKTEEYALEQARRQFGEVKPDDHIECTCLRCANEREMRRRVKEMYDEADELVARAEGGAT
jgi:hypothetical protein